MPPAGVLPALAPSRLSGGPCSQLAIDVADEVAVLTTPLGEQTAMGLDELTGEGLWCPCKGPSQQQQGNIMTATHAQKIMLRDPHTQRLGSLPERAAYALLLAAPISMLQLPSANGM